MRIKKLHIQNFKSLVDFHLEDIPQFCAFVGPNASGKSNIFEALEYSNYLCKGSYEPHELFGGVQQIISYPNLNNNQFSIQGFEFKFDDKTIITYAVHYNITKGTQSIIQEPGLIDDINIESLSVFDISDLKRRAKHINDIKEINIKYNNTYEIFVDNFSRVFVGKTELKKINQSSNKLLIDASNLAQILGKIFQDETKKEDFTEWLSILIPEFKSIDVVKSGIDGSFHIFVYEKSHSKPFPIALLSDGTKNILALMAAVYQSNEPQFLCIEEPENGLHPQAIEQLIELFRIKCEEEGHHIWLNTHSQTLVRSLKTEEIILVNKINGETKAKQLTKKDDYGMKTDEAWLTNFFGGGVL